MKIKNDLLGVTPEVGDIIVFNPARVKGLYKGICVGFTTGGLPILREVSPGQIASGSGKVGDEAIPRTGFAVCKK